MTKRVVVIGAGIGGLAVAALLAKNKFQVTLVEKNNSLGGRARSFSKNGFMFDMGPSWYLMPEIFEGFFNQFDLKTKDLFTLKKLNPHYRIFFENLPPIDIVDDLNTNLNFFESLEKGAKNNVKKYLKESERLYKLAIKNFIYQSYDNLSFLFDKKIINSKASLQTFGSMDNYLKKFTKNDYIKKILSYTIVFLGGSPKNTPALFSMLSHVDFNQGVFYPQGGIISLINSLENICKSQKVKIIKNFEVTSIMIDNGKVIGVKSKSKKIFSDYVISNADLAFTETKLLPEKYQSYPQKYWDKKTIAPSAFILYLGLNKKITKLKHHNLILVNDWEKHFNQIFTHPNWPEKPSYYVCVPSKSDPLVAPKGFENLFILVPIASGLKDTLKKRNKYKDQIISDLENILNQEIKEDIIFKKTFSLNDFKNDYNSYKGTALGLSHTMMQSAFFRPNNRSKKLKNLFFVGQYTNPGIGMPMCVISAEIVAKKIKDDQV